MKRKRIRKSLIELLRILITWVAVGVLVAASIVVESAWKKSEVIEESFVTSSVLLVAVGCLGRIWALSYIAGRKEVELVREGPYSICRHPLYLSSFIGVIGVAAATCTLTFPAIVALGFIALYPFIVAAEERRLRERHGAAYEFYVSTTPSFVPALQRYKTGYGWQFDPRTFQKGLRDGFWFFVALSAMHIVMEMHEAGVLPGVWRVV